MIFKEGDRVRILPDKYGFPEEFIGCTGTVVEIGSRIYAPYDTVYGVKIDGFDKSKLADDAPHVKMWTYGYAFDPKQLEAVTSSTFVPFDYSKVKLKEILPPKERWWTKLRKHLSWGTTPSKGS